MVYFVSLLLQHILYIYYCKLYFGVMLAFKKKIYAVFKYAVVIVPYKNEERKRQISQD
ncbi:MAG: hypothetical protein ACI90V_004295 [Bacillariaceae sp.]|jgi:hypothetical protein